MKKILVTGAKKGLIKEEVEAQKQYCGYYEESKSLAEQAVITVD